MSLLPGVVALSEACDQFLAGCQRNGVEITPDLMVLADELRDAALAARVESGQDVVMVLKADGVREARWA